MSSSIQSTMKNYSWSQIEYSFSSYHAIVTPVSLTMIFSALSVLYVSTQDSRALTEQALTQSYTVFSTDSSSSSISASLGKSLVNSIVIVSVIAAMTFLIVLLYKFKCMKLLWAYMIVSSALLLGFLGSQYFRTGLTRYHIPLDTFTFYYWVCNFCIVGVLVIFFAQHKPIHKDVDDDTGSSSLRSIIGAPRYFTQAYLIATSVILAWQLSNFEEWTTWTLLVLLALYDLCAVLTPCGPLKLLVGLMQRDNAPTLPGLLYEAPLPRGVERRGPSTISTTTATTSTTTSSSTTTRNNNNNNNNIVHNSMNSLPSHPRVIVSPESNTTTTTTNTTTTTTTNTTSSRIPLAIARVYTLDVLDAPFELNQRIERDWAYRRDARRRTNNRLVQEELSSSDQHPLITFSSLELISLVHVRFPFQGGRILPLQQPQEEEEEEEEEETLESSSQFVWRRRRQQQQQQNRNRKSTRIHYQVLDRHGIQRRILTVDDSGQVLQLNHPSEDNGEEDETNEHSSSIKLGLGDFIFYSVLVAKAILYSFTTFASCMLVILAGLGGTLVLLSVYDKALPALPISIFLGVLFYLLTRIVMEPWIKAVMTAPLYV